MNFANISKDYFQYFKNKDIESLGKLFSKKIQLKDWNIDINGYDNVFEQNKIILKNLGNFDLVVKNLSQVDNTVFAEIEIKTEEENTIVLDKLEFDEDGKIFKITAFKG
tara:strand:- start:121 stop:447 length:327 start_codon:yes stop_codon:yes gene_type:complete